MVIGAVLSAAGLLSACGDDEDAACIPGTEACVCPSTKICNAGLVCAADKCVRAGGGMDGGGVDADGGGGTGGDGAVETGPIPTDPNVICAGTQKYCERFNECAPYYIGLEFGTVAKCTERLTLSCLDAVMAPGTGLDGSTMAACTAALATASCDDLVNRNITACNFKGTRATGAACGADEQCATGRCAKTTGACGTCADPAADGAVCAFDEDCAPGRLCNEDDRCVVPAAAQAVCSSARPCRHGFDCIAGTCQPAAMAVGGACAGGTGCSLPHGLYCAGTNMCASIPLGAPGAACRDSAAAPAYCAAGSCVLAQTGDMGTCFAFAADGAACGAANDNELDCQAPALCVSGVCTRVNSATCN